jgi:pimeloyl-ACP methyl ester carboxylesterase
MSGSGKKASHRFELRPTTLEGAISGSVSRPTSVPECGSWVLYLHGFGSSHQGDKAAFFRTRCLGAGIPFVSFDFQGHGESGGSMRDLTIARCLRDVERVRHYAMSLFAGPPVLMGSSMGGLVGLWHGATVPARAGVFIAPALGLDESFVSLIGKEGMSRWRESGILPITNELGTFELGWEFVEDLAVRTLEELEEKHSIPTLIFQGKLDDRVPWEVVQKFVDAAGPTTRLILFSDGGHRLVEKKDVLWERIVGFWRELGILEDETPWASSP